MTIPSLMQKTNGASFFLLALVFIALFPAIPSASFAEDDAVSSVVHGLQFRYSDREGGHIHFDVPVEKPSIWTFTVTVWSEIRHVDGTIERSDAKSQFMWKSRGIIAYDVPIDGKFKDSATDLIRIVLLYGKKTSPRTDWIPLQTIFERIHLKVLTPNQWVKGFVQSPRIIVQFSNTGRPCREGTITATVSNDESGSRDLFSLPLDGDGTVSPEIRIDDLLDGSYELIVSADTPYGTISIQRTVQIASRRIIRLDCPVESAKAGSSVTTRASVHAIPSRAPLSNEPITFQLFDNQRNLLDERLVTSDESGEASYSVTIPAGDKQESCLIIARSGDEGAHQLIEITRETQRDYSISITPDRKQYAADGAIRATVHCRSAKTGKPLAGQRIIYRISTAHRLARVFVTRWLTTDRDGTATVTVDLDPIFERTADHDIPDRLLLSAAIQNSKAETMANAMETVDLSPDHVIMTATLRDNALARSLPVAVEISVRTLDNQAVSCPITVEDRDSGTVLTAHTSSEGIATVEIKPKSIPLRLGISCDIPDVPEKPMRDVVFDRQNVPIMDLLIVNDRERAADSLGEEKGLVVISPLTSGEVYCQLLCSDQLIRTWTVPLENGRAPLTPELLRCAEMETGLRTISVFQFPDSLSDSRPVLRGWRVLPSERPPAPNLSLSKTKERFSSDDTITAKIGEFTESELRHVWIDYYSVDQPVGGDFMKSDLLEEFLNGRDDRAAQRLSNDKAVAPQIAIMPGALFSLSNEDPHALWFRVFQREINDQAGSVWKKIPLTRKNETPITTESLLESKLLLKSDLLDPWGRPLIVDMPGHPIVSAGADGQLSTMDDIVSRGGWWLMQTLVAPEKVTPGKAGLTAVLYDARSVPVAGVGVSLLRLDQTTRELDSGRDGAHYLSTDIDPGTWTLEIKGTPYETLRIPDISLQPGQLTYVRVALADEPGSSLSGLRESTTAAIAAPQLLANVPSNDAVNLAYCSTESVTLTHSAPGMITLSHLPDQASTIAARITPITERGALPPRWLVFQIDRDLVIELDERISAKLSQKTSTSLAVTNKTDEKMTVSITREHLPWFHEKSGKQSITLKPGERSLVSFFLSPKEPGQHTVSYTFTTKTGPASGRSRMRRQLWTVSVGEMASTDCTWLYLQPDRNEPFSLPNGEAKDTGLSLSLSPSPLDLMAFCAAHKPSSPHSTTRKSNTAELMSCLLFHCALQEMLETTESDGSESAIRRRRENSDVLRTLYQNVLSLQIRDGGFSGSDASQADPLSTAIFMDLLTKLRNYLPIDYNVLQEARYWLLISQKSNGLWTGETRSDAFIAMTLAGLSIGIENCRRTLDYFVEPEDHEPADPLTRAYVTTLADRLGTFATDQHKAIRSWKVPMSPSKVDQLMMLARRSESGDPAAASIMIPELLQWYLQRTSETNPISTVEITRALIDAIRGVPPISSAVDLNITGCNSENLSFHVDPLNPKSLSLLIPLPCPEQKATNAQEKLIGISSSARFPLFIRICTVSWTPDE